MTNEQRDVLLSICDEMLDVKQDYQSLVVKGGKPKDLVYLEMKLVRVKDGRIVNASL